MPIHKIILGGHQYLGFAMGQLRTLAKLAAGQGGYATKVFSLPDATITLRIAGDQQFVRMEGSGGANYEFFTSEHIGYDRFNELQAEFPGDYTKWEHVYALGTPGYSTTEAGLPGEPTFLPHVAGHFTSVKFGKPDPIYSHTLTPPAPEGVEAWKLLPTSFVEGEVIAGLKTIRTPYSWQIQKFTEAVFWPGNGSLSLVSSTQAMAPGRGGTCNLSSPGVRKSGYLAFGGGGGIVQYPDPSYVLDAGFDVMPTYLSNGLAIAKGPDYPDEGVWWRRAAVAKSDLGNLFFICTDNIGRFQVYRVIGSYEVANSVTKGYRRIPNTEYLEYTPDYPSWVTVPALPVDQSSSGDAAFEDAYWLWSFNKDGTKAAAVAFGSTYGPHSRKVKGIGFIHAEQIAASGAVDDAVLARDDTPGIVEFGISITETGTGDTDFSVAFTLLRNEDSTTVGRYPLEVAYALPGVTGATEGDLLLSEIECIVPSGGYEAGAVDGDLTYLDTISYLTTYYVASRLNDDLSRTELHRFKESNNESFRFLDWDEFYALPAPTQASITLDHLVPKRPFSLTAGGTINGRGNGPLAPDSAYDDTRTYSGSLWSADLRSLSFFFSYTDQLAIQVGHHLMAFGKTIMKVDTPVVLSPGDAAIIAGMSPGNPAETSGAPTALPNATFLRTCRYKQSRVLQTAVWAGFSVHPAGHWSHIGPHGVDEEFDIIQAKGAARRSHKSLFNKAFGQTRTHDFYGQTYTDGLEDGSGNATADTGSFRTNGIWITF